MWSVMRLTSIYNKCNKIDWSPTLCADIVQFSRPEILSVFVKSFIRETFVRVKRHSERCIHFFVRCSMYISPCRENLLFWTWMHRRLGTAVKTLPAKLSGIDAWSTKREFISSRWSCRNFVLKHEIWHKNFQASKCFLTYFVADV